MTSDCSSSQAVIWGLKLPLLVDLRLRKQQLMNDVIKFSVSLFHSLPCFFFYDKKPFNGKRQALLVTIISNI